MKNGIVIADSGPIFSLALIDKLNLLHMLFEEVYIFQAVWNEITLKRNEVFQTKIELYFKDKVKNISSENKLNSIMDLGESESIILYNELSANYLLIDDKKARQIADTMNVNCIGTLAVLIKSTEKDLIKELKPLFIQLLTNKRYYSLTLLNNILSKNNEDIIE